MISFDSLKLESSVQHLKDKPRVLPTPPVSGAPSSTRLPVATDHEASLLVRQSRPAVMTRPAPSADNQDLMSFESIAPWTTQTVVPHPTQPRVLPVPPPQAATRTVSPIPSDDPTGSLVNQPLLMDALNPSSKPQPRPNWVQFTVSCSCGSHCELLVTTGSSFWLFFCLTATIVPNKRASRWSCGSTT